MIMNPLLFLIIIPVLTMAAIVMVKDLTKVRSIAATGMTVQLIFSFVLL